MEAFDIFLSEIAYCWSFGKPCRIRDPLLLTVRLLLSCLEARKIAFDDWLAAQSGDNGSQVVLLVADNSLDWQRHSLNHLRWLAHSFPVKSAIDSQQKCETIRLGISYNVLRCKD